MNLLISENLKDGGISEFLRYYSQILYQKSNILFINLLWILEVVKRKNKSEEKVKRKDNIRTRSVIGINFNKFKSTRLIQFISLSLHKKKMFNTVHKGPISFSETYY